MFPQTEREIILRLFPKSKKLFTRKNLNIKEKVVIFV